jgi:flagellar hook-associated protein 1 FlgK
VSVTFSSADGSIERTITIAPLLGGETAAGIATRLNDQIALDPALAGTISFSDPGNGQLKVVLTDTAGQGFRFTADTSNPAFTTGLEGGGTLGGQSAQEIAGALNAQLALNPALAAAGVRFSAVGGEIKIDADVLFDFTVTEAPGATTDAFGAPDVTGFASGLPPAGTAGGAQAAFTLTVANLSPAEIAAGTSTDPDGNDNIAALATLVNTPILSGVKFSEFYAQIVVAVGEEGADAAAQLETREQILITAQNLRDSLSGVDVNEEAVQLLQFEQSFQAMLRVVQVVDGLVNEILRLVD